MTIGASVFFFLFLINLIWQKPGQEGETKAATTAAGSDGSEATTPMETSSPDKKETKTETGVQKKGHIPSTSSGGVGALQLPPSEGNVATASAAALAAAAVKAKVRRERGEEGEKYCNLR